MKLIKFVSIFVLFMSGILTCNGEELVKEKAEEYATQISDFSEVFQFDKDSAYSIIDGVLYYQSTLYLYPALKEDSVFRVPDGITGIDINAFAYNHEQLESIYFPETCVHIGFDENYESIWMTGDRYSTRNYSVSECHPFFSVQDGVLFSKDKKILLLYPTRNQEKCYVVPEGTETIGAFAFESSEIEQVVLPDTVKTISEGAFYGSKIRQIILNEGLLSIEDFAFEGCPYLESPVLPSTLLSIGSYALAECRSINHIVLPEGIKSIDTYAFCFSPIKEIILPSGLEYVGDDICYDALLVWENND